MRIRNLCFFAVILLATVFLNASCSKSSSPAAPAAGSPSQPPSATDTPGCGGTDQPSCTPTYTPTLTYTSTRTLSPTNTFPPGTHTPTPADTHTFTPSYTATSSYTRTPTMTDTPSAAPTNTPTHTFTIYIPPVNTLTRTHTFTPTWSRTFTPTPTNTSYCPLAATPFTVASLPVSLIGNTSGGTNNFSCGFGCPAADHVYTFTLTQAHVLTFASCATEPTWMQTLSLRTVCTTPDVEGMMCGSTSRGSSITADLQPGTYYLIVDGTYAASDAGPYTVVISGGLATATFTPTHTATFTHTPTFTPTIYCGVPTIDVSSYLMAGTSYSGTCDSDNIPGGPGVGYGYADSVLYIHLTEARYVTASLCADGQTWGALLSIRGICDQYASNYAFAFANCGSRAQVGVWLEAGNYFIVVDGAPNGGSYTLALSSAFTAPTVTSTPTPTITLTPTRTSTPTFTPTYSSTPSPTPTYDCSTSPELGDIPSGTIVIQGDTSAGSDKTHTIQESVAYGMGYPDDIYHLHVPYDLVGLRIRVCSKDFDPVLYLRKTENCLDDKGSFLFDDDSGDAYCSGGAEITWDLGAGNYWVIVDSKDGSGPYELTASAK